MNNETKLNSGQKISYARYGILNGTPAYYFHGLPGSRFEGQLLHKACVEHGIDLIAPDRFGYGNTPACEGDRYLAWVNGINELADQLHFDKFYLLAASGGGPYALACASILSQRVMGTAVCCGLGSLAIKELRRPMIPLAKLAAFLGKHYPWLLKMSLGMSTGIAARYFSNQSLSILGAVMGGRDKLALAKSDVRQIMIKSIRCAFEQGSEGGVGDLIAAGQTWPFKLSDIQHLQLWHGDRDKIVPLAHSKWLQQQVPAAELKVIPGEGHFSLPICYADQVVESLLKLK